MIVVRSHSDVIIGIVVIVIDVRSHSDVITGIIVMGVGCMQNVQSKDQERSLLFFAPFTDGLLNLPILTKR